MYHKLRLLVDKSKCLQSQKFSTISAAVVAYKIDFLQYSETNLFLQFSVAWSFVITMFYGCRVIVLMANGTYFMTFYHCNSSDHILRFAEEFFRAFHNSYQDFYTLYFAPDKTCSQRLISITYPFCPLKVLDHCVLATFV